MRRDAKPSSFAAFTDGWFRFPNSKSMGMCTFSRGIVYANAIVIVIGDVRRFSARQIALASGPYGRPFALTDRSTR